MRCINWLMLAISSGLFAGFIPDQLTGKKSGKGGGTAGTAFAFLIQLWLLFYTAHPFIWSLTLIIATLALGLVSIAPGEELMCKLWGPGKRHTGQIVTHDRNQTCIDELHGQFIAGLPVFAVVMTVGYQAIWLVASFALFRIFDGLKPWPIKAVEKKCGETPFGIMLDDTLAGIVAGAILLIIYLVTVLP